MHGQQKPNLRGLLRLDGPLLKSNATTGDPRDICLLFASLVDSSNR